jgi:hypothetical protein
LKGRVATTGWGWAQKSSGPSLIQNQSIYFNSMIKKIIQYFKRDVAVTDCAHAKKSLDPSRIQNYNFWKFIRKITFKKIDSELDEKCEKC